ncbi:hypothetical protein C8J56DRAFT_464509 [Mycena floridula]|nr:hypothetical protein C8J56DRAFT_464509 [Mycena floridula]
MAVEGHSCAVVGGFLGDEGSWVVVGIRILLWKQGGDASRREEEGGICKTSSCLPRIVTMLKFSHLRHCRYPVQGSSSLVLAEIAESRPLRSVNLMSSSSLGHRIQWWWLLRAENETLFSSKEGLVFAFGETAFSGYLGPINLCLLLLLRHRSFVEASWNCFVEDIWELLTGPSHIRLVHNPFFPANRRLLGPQALVRCQYSPLACPSWRLVQLPSSTSIPMTNRHGAGIWTVVGLRAETKDPGESSMES